MGQEARVLVCEDDSAIRTLVELLLRRRGYTVDVAVDGEAAITALAGRPYDVVILDLLMPGTTGYAVLDFLQQNHPRQLSRVIITTASQSAFREVFPIASMIRKPFDIYELEELVRRVAGGLDASGSATTVFA